MSDQFLEADYQIPEESSYMSLEDGKNKFRFLSKPITGMEFWKTVKDKRTPIRKRMGESIPLSELGTNKWGNPDKPKHFWAMVVYNYRVNKIQILEITQKTIITSILALAKDGDWGDPRNYDITVTKTGKDLETEYHVMPQPAKPLDPKIKQEYENTTINLEALFSGEDPFNSTTEPEEAMDESVPLDEVPF